MSFVDTVGPFVFFCLLGAAVFIAVAAWVVLWLIPQFNVARHQDRVTRDHLRFNEAARQLVDDLIVENSATALIPDRVMKQVWALKELGDDITGRKAVR